MSKLICFFICVILVGCGGGDSQSETEPQTSTPEVRSYCFNLGVKYNTNKASDIVPIRDLYANVYPAQESSKVINSDGINRSRLSVNSVSPVFNVDVFMFGKFWVSHRVQFIAGDRMVSLMVDTVNGTEAGTAGVNVNYEPDFRPLNNCLN